MHSNFDSALGSLTSGEGDIINLWLEGWTKMGGTYSQLVENIKSEEHLPLDALKSLIALCGNKFSMEGIISESDFDSICKDFSRMGPSMDAALRPKILGRIEKWANFLRRCIPENDDVDSPDEGDIRFRVEQICACQGDMLSVTSQANSSRPSPVIWGAFAVNKDEVIFDPPLNVLRNAVVALGLGYYYHQLSNIRLLRVSYTPPDNEPLLVPTIGDAGSYEYFRPAQRRTEDLPAPHGWTKPLEKVEGIIPQPEIVHKNCNWVLSARPT